MTGPKFTLFAHRRADAWFPLTANQTAVRFELRFRNFSVSPSLKARSRSAFHERVAVCSPMTKIISILPPPLRNLFSTLGQPTCCHFLPLFGLQWIATKSKTRPSDLSERSQASDYLPSNISGPFELWFEARLFKFRLSVSSFSSQTLLLFSRNPKLS